jgi:hypothetical protein
VGQIKLNPDYARQFLLALYSSFFSQDQAAAFLEVRGKREGEGLKFRKFYRTPETLLKDLGKWQPGRNYWIGVALRNNDKAGTKDDLLALTAAFCDVDVGSAGHKEATRYKTKEEAQAAIEAFPLRPSILVDSGGGFQPYWLFREPVKLSQETIKRLEGINRSVARALGGDVAATDAARILRLPGTFNLKLAGQPRPVKIIWCEPERVYNLEAFAPYEAQGQEQKKGRTGGQGTGAAPAAGDYAAYGQKALADELAKLAGKPEGSEDRNNQLNRSAFALGQLVGAGILDRGQVEAALSGTAAGIGLGEVEVQATIRSGLEAGIKEPRELPERTGKGGNGSRQGRPPGGAERGHQGGQGGPETERIWWVGHCYFIERGRLCLEVIDREGRPDSRALANFQAQIEEEISRDDGLKKIKEFHITGSLDTGQPLPLAQVPADKFDSLAWVKKEWGAGASVAPGRSLGPHLVNAIQAHSQRFKRRTIYAHSGWRQIGGTWRYLHGGGALGPGEQIEVDLGENLGNYRLPAPGGLEAAQASLRFLEVAPWEVTAPILAAVYLAPFADLLKIDFSLWIYGPTGAMKSTLAALALCHFGEFTRTSLPASWFSTVNSLERLCFTLKDCLVVVDDFAPSASAKDFHHLGERAGRLIYQAGNRSGRGRLAPDLTARPNYYPRGLILSTGEVLLPGQRQSATARYLGIELDSKKTPVDKARLTVAQDEAYLYGGAMAAYLEDLAPRLEKVQEEIRALFEAYREAFQGAGHARIPEIQAWLALGFEFAMRFFVRQGAITGDRKYEMEKQAWQVWKTMGEKHSRLIEGERPTLKFLAILNELFLTSKIYAESREFQGGKPPKENLLGWQGNEPAHNAYLVGYADDAMVYLLPDTALRAVNEAIRAQGDFLSLGRNELWAALAREGIIAPGAGGRTTRVIKIQGGYRRVICLPLENLIEEEGEDEDRQPLEQPRQPPTTTTWLS